MTTVLPYSKQNFTFKPIVKRQYDLLISSQFRKDIFSNFEFDYHFFNLLAENGNIPLTDISWLDRPYLELWLRSWNFSSSVQLFGKKEKVDFVLDDIFFSRLALPTVESQSFSIDDENTMVLSVPSVKREFDFLSKLKLVENKELSNSTDFLKKFTEFNVIKFIDRIKKSDNDEKYCSFEKDSSEFYKFLSSIPLSHYKRVIDFASNAFNLYMSAYKVEGGSGKVFMLPERLALFL